MKELLRFKLAKELEGARVTVEIWNKQKLVGCIYPHEASVSIVSKYLENIHLDKKVPPKATISFMI